MSEPKVDTSSFSRDAALIDQPSKGLLVVKGKDGLDLLHRISTNDLRGMGEGDVVQTIFTTEKGRLIDIVDVIQMDEGDVRIATSSRDPVVLNWIKKFIIMEDVEITDISESNSHLSLVGHHSQKVAEELDLERGAAIQLNEQHVVALVYRPFLFGESQLNFLVNESYVGQLKNWLLDRSPRLRNESQSMYEHWRIVEGIPAFGKEITAEYNPFEVGLAGAISFTKGCYVGQEVIARLDTYDKVQKQLVSIAFKEMIADDLLPTPIFHNGLEIGTVTSVSPLFADESYAALAVVKRKSIVDGETLYAIDDSGHQIVGVVSLVPVPPPRSAVKPSIRT